ncbi:phosphotransferase [bacterium]|nr:phosphotransferase [bacterium]
MTDAPATGTPTAEWDIDADLVRRLLREQHPDLVTADLRLLDTGWDNVFFRLGDRHVVRLPRRQLAVPLIVHEQTWLPQLASLLPVSIPAPVRLGQSTDEFLHPWSILPWLPGEPADVAPPASDQARLLADFLRALHQIAPADAPHNPYRGVPLQQRATSVDERLQRLCRTTDAVTPEIDRLWKQALDVPTSAERCWLHGDLHARNVLVQNGSISGIIDWGDLTAGDVATDLAGIWSLLAAPESRANCLDLYGATDTEIGRARGWAIVFGSALLDSGSIDHPRHAAMGRVILQRLIEDV